MSAMAAQLADAGLTGFEFAGGIPGTLGGGITMNAGAYGGEIKDCIESAVIMTEQGEIRELTKEELQLGYRSSVIQKENYIVLEGTFLFHEGKKEEIQAAMRELNQKRRDKQPLEFPSAGSTFKRPEGYFAGKLIQDAGLRGYRVGDAQVAEKHCGFVINRGQATAAEVERLIQDVQEKVQEKFGVRLEPEVRIVGCE
jgi:UDP-N-acetylmuramate dehydrogenase